MSLDLRNFVQVNINYNKTNISSVERGIVTLITINTDFSDNPFRAREITIEGETYDWDGIFRSEAQYQNLKTPLGVASSALDNYVKAFFSNKGRGLQIIGGYSTGDQETWIKNIVLGLDYKYVIIVSDVSESIMRAVAVANGSTVTATNPITGETTVPTLSGLNEKYFISSTTDTSLTISNEENYPNYLIKIGSKGIEMLPAAYLSQVKLSDASTIADYNFTIEDISMFTESESLIENNATGVALIGKHFNFTTELVNATRNICGDSVSGIDMMNYYVKILVCQTLTEKVMEILTSKIRCNQSGINRVNNAISQEMNRYVSNGYLNTDYIWTNEDLYYTYNGEQYLVCARNTPLVKGYKSIILPISALTEEQRQNHAFPPIYMLLADQDSVRAIVINGDVY